MELVTIRVPSVGNDLSLSFAEREVIAASRGYNDSIERRKYHLITSCETCYPSSMHGLSNHRSCKGYSAQNGKIRMGSHDGSASVKDAE